jgi:hypothetical protein
VALDRRPPARSPLTPMPLLDLTVVVLVRLVHRIHHTDAPSA